MGWKMESLFHALGYSRNPGNHNLYKQMGYGGERLGWEKYLKACEYAGLPHAYAAVHYARLQVPEEFRKYIGCTVAPGKRRTPGKMKKAEFTALNEPLLQEIPRGVPIPDV